MLNKKDYCNCDICIALQQMGYNESSEYTWAHNCRVSDEILDKYPGLSDSGYMDLIDEYGGIYKREEVYHTYIEPIKRFSRNSMIDTDFGEICSCVHLYDAQKFLRKEKKIHVEVPIAFNKYFYELFKTDEYDKHCGIQKVLVLGTNGYESHEEAHLEGIKEAINLLKEEK